MAYITTQFIHYFPNIILSMMRKFTGTDEKPKVLTPDQHKKVSKILGKIGKTSAENLTDEERENLTSSLESDR